jgi:hypothetical protein
VGRGIPKSHSGLHSCEEHFPSSQVSTDWKALASDLLSGCVYSWLYTGTSACLYIYIWWHWGLNSGPTPWASPPALFSDGLFWDRVLWTICLGWVRTAVLLISASWVARITGVSHRIWPFFLFSIFWLVPNFLPDMTEINYVIELKGWHPLLSKFLQEEVTCHKRHHLSQEPRKLG